MRNIHQAALGFLAALLSGVIIIGSLTLSFVEGGIPLAKGPSSAARDGTALTAPPVSSTSEPFSSMQSSSVSSSSTSTPSSATSSSATTSSALISPSPRPATATLLPPTDTLPASTCEHPNNWVGIFIQIGDTLQTLALTYGTTPEALRQYNCLPGETLPPNTRLFVPPLPATAALPTSTTPPTNMPARPIATNTRCGPPPGWFIYTVRPGDTLFQISILTRSTVAQLQSANCLGSTSVIRVGQQLYVPVLPATSVPPTASRTSPPSSTPLPPPTDTPAPPTIAPPTAEPTTAVPPTLEPPPTLAPDTPTAAAAEIEDTTTPIPPASTATSATDEPEEVWPQVSPSPTTPATHQEPEASPTAPA